MKKILIIEDTEEIKELIQKALEGRSDEAIVAERNGIIDDHHAMLRSIEPITKIIPHHNITIRNTTKKTAITRNKCGKGITPIIHRYNSPPKIIN